MTAVGHEPVFWLKIEPEWMTYEMPAVRVSEHIGQVITAPSSVYKHGRSWGDLDVSPAH